MAITRQKKENILGKLGDIKNSAKSLVFVGFKGLGVGETTAMRSKLREAGVGYFVAKKTLIHRALNDAFEGAIPSLDGEVAIAYGNDDLTPAQNVRAFAKEYADSISILGGVFEGVYKNSEEMNTIASIPGMPALRGMFVNVINSPIQGLTIALNAIADKRSAV